jgi:hypothetical protein
VSAKSIRKAASGLSLSDYKYPPSPPLLLFSFPTQHWLATSVQVRFIDTIPLDININNIDIHVVDIVTIGKRPFGRQPLWTTTPLDDNPFGRQPLWTTTPLDDNPFGRQPLWTTTPFDDNPLGRQHQQHQKHRRISNSGLYEQACLLMDAQL